MTNSEDLDKVKDALKKLREKIAKIKPSDHEEGVHCSGEHRGHERGIQIGVDATNIDFTITGYRGHSFLMGNNSKIYVQSFTMGLDTAYLDSYSELSEEEFLERISRLPEENMANPNFVSAYIQSKLEKLV
ncbi:hypothetical protein J4447_04570 [Candidatus Pacearchaeota archaeon]|nr:hypothetical protein [Candidatus Pacearchaeota archaeon]